EARRQGCRHAVLETFDSRARDVYARLGYAPLVELADLPHGHARFFMRKSLVSRTARGTLSAPDLARMGAAGIYDPGAPDAAAQRSVLQLLATNGIAADEILAAHRLGDLVMRGFEHLIRPGDRHSEEEAAAAVGWEVSVVRRIWRA